MARPGLAVSGLLALLRGKRVRAWNRICLASARHPDCYAAWIKTVEPTLLPPAGSAASRQVGAVLIGGDSKATRASLEAAFGINVPVFDVSAGIPVSNRPAWLLPIRAGDLVSPALGAVLATRLDGCDARLVYWDEDRLDSKGRTAPWIKPDWDPLLFGRHDGLIGSSVLRANTAIGESVEDWSALVRGLAEETAPLHLPLILTHRKEIRYASPRPEIAVPRVSISVIVPTRDRADLLEACLDGLSNTRFPDAREIIIVDNDSREPRTKALFERLKATGQARVLSRPGLFNFAALANAGVASASGELVCLLNNDVEIVSCEWLEQMAALAVRDDVGAVGARLLYPDRAIQHAGVALGIGGAAGHVDKGARPVPGVFAPWHDETRTISAVTAACLLVDRAKFAAVGGMDEQSFAIDFNDVDLCLRLAASNWRTVYCASATLIHHESRSRGKTRRGSDLSRFERELQALRTRWGTETAIDRYHSPLFRRQSERCLLAF
jgi:GT2 family glycosyltransferase